MTEIVIGIDGGGSHTEACLAHPETGRLFRAEAGPSNMHVVGLEAACEAITGAARGALCAARDSLDLPEATPVSAMACCLSGAGRGTERRAISKNLKGRNLAQRILLTHDAEATLASAMVFGPGIALVAGTGSFAWGRGEGNREARADGWGSLLGDESGAFGIGLESLRAACRFYDGHGRETRLLDLAFEHYGVSDASGLLDIVATPTIPRDLISRFAPMAFQAAEAMDAEALEIVESAIGGLAKSALAVRRKLFQNDESATFVLGGKLIRNQKYYQERFASFVHGLYSQDRIFCPRDSLSLGAARIALAALGSDCESALPLSEKDLGEIVPECRAEAVAEGRRVFEECAALATERLNPEAAQIDEGSALEFVRLMNREDLRVAPAVGEVLPQIAEAVERISEAFRKEGRLFYIGAGTSGRLGCLDAAECPPTFGSEPRMVQGVIAGGVATLLRSREGAEDRRDDALRDLRARGFGPRDVLVGLAASSRTPYVLAGLEYAHGIGATTILVTCSKPMKENVNIDILIAALVGPEAVMGSTRLKAATAQKMILNMLTTASMARMGKVYKGMMVDLQMSCDKLTERAKRTVMTLTGLEYDGAAEALAAAGGSVKRALVMTECNCTARQADAALAQAQGQVRPAIQGMKGGS